MATAARISKELSIKQVDLEWTFCEWLSTYLYKSNPMPNLEVKNVAAGDLDEKYELQGIVFNDVDPSQYEKQSKLYPETQSKGHARS